VGTGVILADSVSFPEAMQFLLLIMPLIAFAEVLLSDIMLPPHYLNFVVGLIPTTVMFVCCFLAAAFHWPSSVFHRDDFVVELFSVNNQPFEFSPRGMVIGSSFIIAIFCFRTIILRTRDEGQTLVAIRFPYNFHFFQEKCGQVSPEPTARIDDEISEGKSTEIEQASHQIVSIVPLNLGFSINKNSRILINYILPPRIASRILWLKRRSSRAVQFMWIMNVAFGGVIGFLLGLRVEYSYREITYAISLMLSTLLTLTEILCEINLTIANKTIRTFQFWFLFLIILIHYSSLMCSYGLYQASVFTKTYTAGIIVLMSVYALFGDALVFSRLTKIALALCVVSVESFFIVLSSFRIGLWSNADFKLERANLGPVGYFW
jgi:hypothetical protein